LGVYLLPIIVKKVNDKVKRVNKEGTPQSAPIYALQELIFNEELIRSLRKIAHKKLDLSFFIKSNAAAYGDSVNVNTSFHPEAVLECIDIIRHAFQERENGFIGSIIYKGVYDEKGERLTEAFVEIDEGKPDNKKIDRWGQIKAWGFKASFQWCDGGKRGRLNLAKKKHVLYDVLYDLSDDVRKRIKGDQLNYEVKKTRFYDTIEPELKHIEMLAKYAKKNGCELQIVYG